MFELLDLKGFEYIPVQWKQNINLPACISFKVLRQKVFAYGICLKRNVDFCETKPFILPFEVRLYIRQGHL